MKKFLSALLCTAILITICSPLMVGFSASDTFGSADIIFDEYGYGYRMIDDSGKEIPVSTDSPAGYGLNYGDGPDAAGEYVLDYITLPDGTPEQASTLLPSRIRVHPHAAGRLQPAPLLKPMP